MATTATSLPATVPIPDMPGLLRRLHTIHLSRASGVWYALMPMQLVPGVAFGYGTRSRTLRGVGRTRRAALEALHRDVRKRPGLRLAPWRWIRDQVAALVESTPCR